MAINLAQRIGQEFKNLRSGELSTKADQSSTYTKTEVDTNIAAEASTRASADTALGARIDSILTNTDAEALNSLTEIVTAFQSADGNLSQAITTALSTHTSELATETTARITGDAATLASANTYTDSVIVPSVKTYLGSLDQSIVPDTDLAYDLGSSTKRFGSLYLAGQTIYLGDITLSKDAGGGLSVTGADNLPVTVNLDANTTDDLAQGVVNKYFDNSLARSALSFTAGSGDYNATTGIITIPTNTNQLTNGADFATVSAVTAEASRAAAAEALLAPKVSPTFTGTTTIDGTFGNIYLTTYGSIFVDGDSTNNIVQASSLARTKGGGLWSTGGNTRIYSVDAIEFRTGVTLRDQDTPQDGTTVLTIATSGNITSTGTVTANSVLLTGNTGTVTSVEPGTGLSGGTITTTGTISLADTAVTAGSYTTANITVDAQGRITAASSGSGGATITDDTTTVATYYPLLAAGTTGTLTDSKVSSTKLTFNPSTGDLGAINFNSLSDANAKKDVSTIQDALSKVMAMRGVNYTLIESNQKLVGVIAQEMEQIIPEVVSTNENGIKSVSYGNIVGILIEAIKELQLEVQSLKDYK